MYVGHLDDVHKGVGILLEAIQKLLSNYKDLLIKFEFCGEGPLKNKILMLKNLYPERIIYEGYIPNDKISFHYALSDIFLFTSRREPFGRVLIEALGGELIIICTKTIGSVEILKNKKFAYFINLNVQEICEKILEIYMVWENNYNQFRDLQKKAKIYARQNFSLSNEIGDFKILINNISKI
ncbi:MAG: glycosyltransferase family 4 protein [Candidatus Lokiarchaeota archaeon]